VSPRVKPKRTADDVLDLAANRLARGELAEARVERLLLQANRGRSELAEFRSKAANGERTHAASPDEVWWKYLLTPAVPKVVNLGEGERTVADLLKATPAAPVREELAEKIAPALTDEPQKRADLARAVGRDPKDGSVLNALEWLELNKRAERTPKGWKRR
jgi:hypothetical protein